MLAPSRPRLDTEVARRRCEPVHLCGLGLDDRTQTGSRDDKRASAVAHVVATERRILGVVETHDERRMPACMTARMHSSPALRSGIPYPRPTVASGSRCTRRTAPRT